MSSRGRRPISLPHLAAAVMAAIAVYLGTLKGGFVWDDSPLILSNALITSLRHLPQIFGTHAFAGMGRDFVKGMDTEYYRPVWIASYALDYALWGTRAFGYHLANVLLHACVTALVYVFAAGVLSEWPALIAALLFAVHPVHAEAVAWISGRNELLCALFMMMAFLSYIRFRERGGVAAVVVCVVAFQVALLSKEMAITLPALAFLYELRTRSARAALAGAGLLAASAAPYLLLRNAMVIMPAHPEDPSSASRIATAPHVLVEYLRLLIAPLRLNVLHTVPPEPSLTSAGMFVWLAVLALVVWGIRRAWQWDRTVGFGLAWSLLALAPVSGIPALIRPAAVADRYLYIPSIGFCIAAAAALARVSLARAGRTSAVAIAPALAVVALLAVGAVVHAAAWRDELTFSTRMIADAPGASQGWFNRSVYEMNAGRLDTAAQDMERAVAITPRDPRAHLYLGEIEARRGNVAAARGHLQTALDLAPRMVGALDELGKLEYGQGRHDQAIRAFRSALTVSPDNLDALLGLGAAFQGGGQLDSAEVEFRAALRVDPANLSGRQNLAMVLGARGRYPEAEQELKRAMATAPDDPEPHYNLGVMLQTQGRWADAEHEFRAAITRKDDMANAHNNLGVMLLKQGRGREGRREVERAIALDPANPLFKQNLSYFAPASADSK